jgi:hypothetical protein
MLSCAILASNNLGAFAMKPDQVFNEDKVSVVAENIGVITETNPP